MRKIPRCFLGILAAACLTAAAQTGPEKANLTSAAAGAKVVAFSSNYGGSWDVTNLIGGSEDWYGPLPAWCTESEAPFPHWAVIELPKKAWLTTLIFNNIIPDEEGGWEGISAKDVRLETSTTSADQGFQTVASFRLERNKNNQLVHIEPIEARWIKIVLTSNWGNVEYTELGKLGVFDDGTRRTNIGDELKTKGFVDLYGIYFDFGSATLKPESQPVLDTIARFSKGNPGVKLAIEGHTDNVGEAARNQALSESRAKSVVEALVAAGIDRSSLMSAGFGASKPVADNTTITGRAQNRRVTVRVMK
jgi:outer membrane protein OmpA-like peptidoglycan-associated protein